MKNDVLVLGNVLYALIEKKHPRESTMENHLREGDMYYDGDMQESNRSDELFDFMVKCSMKDVEKQWSVEESMRVSAERESEQ